MHTRRLSLLALTAVTLLTTGLRAQTYDYYDLGNLPSGNITITGVTGNVTYVVTGSEALGISPTGHVVGDVDITASSGGLNGEIESVVREFTYFNGMTTSFGTDESGNSSFGAGINAAGQIVGGTEFSSHPDRYEALRYSGGVFQIVDDVATGLESEALAINKAGNVAGWADVDISITNNTQVENEKAIFWEGGEPLQLKDLTPTTINTTTEAELSAQANAINSSNKIAGFSDVLDSGILTVHACVMAFGSPALDLGTLAGSSNPAAESFALGINDLGEVVGNSTSTVISPTGAFAHAFMSPSQANSMTDLGVLSAVGGRTSTAYGINNSNTVVGQADENGGGEVVAVVWPNGAPGPIDLNTITNNAGNFVMQIAYAVNDFGEIVGTAFNPVTEVSHGFLLIPTALDTPLVVSTPPANFQALVGQNVTISSNISGGTPTFQWFFNGVAINGATSANLTINNVQFSSAGNYSVTASNLLGNHSESVTMTVIQAATITSQPGGVNSEVGVIAGRPASFTVGAVGSGTLTYQWQISTDSGNTWANVTNGSPYSGATSATLTINPTTLAMNDQLFQCILNNVADIANTTIPAELIVGVPAAITIPPGNLTVNQSFNANLTVTATGTPPFNVQWTHAGAVLAGANTTVSGNVSTTFETIISTLPITNAQTANAGSYSVAVSNALGAVTSTANVTVVLLPNVTKQPASVGITAGKNATFSITATGTPTLTYQWQSSPNGLNPWTNLANSSAFTGTTTPTLSVVNATLAMNATEFRCVVNNPSNIAVPSNAATLTVGVPPTITTKPLTQAVNQGTSPTLTVLASGTAPLTYQWSFAGKPIAGATSSSFTITGNGSGIQAANAGAYSVVVSNAVGNVTTSANVSVILLPVITSQPVNSTLVANKSTSFKVTATGTAPLTYQWQQSINGGSSFSNLTNVAPFGGVTTSTLSISNATLAMNGTEYQVVVNNPSGVANTSIPALLSTGLVPTIANTTVNGIGNHTTNQGASITLSVTPSGTAPFTYVWKHGTTVLSSNTSSLTIASPQAADAGAYSVLITNLYGNVTSTGNLTVIILPVITSQPVNSTLVANKSTSFKVTATGTAPLTYQWQQSINGGSSFSNLTNVAPFGGVTTSTLSISNATLAMNGTEYQVVVNNPSGVANTSIPALLSTGLVPTIANTTVNGIGNHTTNQGASITLSVTPSGTAPFTYVWKHGTTVLSSNTSSLTIASPQAADAGAYSVLITNPYGNVTSTGNLTVIILPVITSQPAPSTVVAGKATSFKVVATGTAPLTYQWGSSSSISGPFTPVVNGAGISGNNTAALAISNATLAMNGTYFAVTVNNPSGVANTSTPALLSTGIVPIITTPPGNQTVNQGSTATLTVVVSANTTSPINYQWSQGNSTISGATSATLTIPNAQTANAGKYSVSVVNPYGSATASANLTVINLPAITSEPGNQTIIAGKSALFKVTATGTPTLTYIWQSSPDGTTWSNLTNTGAFSGVTTANLSISSTTLTMNGTQFRAIVNNGANPAVPATSNAAFLFVGNSPVITSLTPGNSTINQGTPITYTVAVTANSTTPLTYQWSLNGVTLGNQTNPTLTIASPQGTDAGKYSVLVSNAWGNATASSNLTVILLPVINSGGQPANFAAAVGKSATFTVSAGGTGPLVYQWQLSTDGGSTFTNIASNDTRFTGAATASLKVGATTFAMNGWEFQVVITNSSRVSTTSNPATLTVGNPPVITSPPSNQTATAGGNVTLSVLATGDPTLVYQWSLGANPLTDGTNVSGSIVSGSATATLTLTNVQTTDAGNYFVMVSNAYGTASAQAMLTVNAVTPALVRGSSAGGTSADTGASNSGSSSDNVALAQPQEPGDFTVTSGELASVIIVPGSTLTPADVSSELLSAMNLNAASDVSLLPSATTVEANSVSDALLEFRQAKTAAGLALTVQYGYATGDSPPADWQDVPLSAITQLPDADASTAVYEARIAVPEGESVYFRISTAD